ncbi:MAG TPA: thrombospondin type 3 repeat-containing protein [Polyangiaceae bacterium]|jgi:hypothetical protein|nr:thrombospondin type 3 repeat-containing protein [Polyangiaceae bacterium]
MTKTRQSLSLSVLAFLTFGLSSPAQAKPEFPSEIQSDLKLSYLVPCSVCHIEDNTGSSTPITPFALALRARGLSGDNGSVGTSLALLAADGVDSDGDGVTDIAELKAGTDPNSSANASLINDQEPGYGCGGSPPTGRSEGGPAIGSALALAWLFVQRRRGRP